MPGQELFFHIQLLSSAAASMNPQVGRESANFDSSNINAYEEHEHVASFDGLADRDLSFP
jgi:hypothetical protein